MSALHHCMPIQRWIINIRPHLCWFVSVRCNICTWLSKKNLSCARFMNQSLLFQLFALICSIFGTSIVLLNKRSRKEKKKIQRHFQQKSLRSEKNGVEKTYSTNIFPEWNAVNSISVIQFSVCGWKAFPFIYATHPERVNLNLMWNRKQMRPLKTKQKIMQIGKEICCPF